jgi:hypothetical protein
MTLILDAGKVEQIEREATTSKLPKIADFLQNQIGQKLTAYVAGLTDPKAVGSWIRGENDPRQPADMRLRYAYQVVRMLTEAYDAETAKAWLFGSNTRLNDEAPAYLLRNAKAVDDLRQLVPTARAFAGSAE